MIEQSYQQNWMNVKIDLGLQTEDCAVWQEAPEVKGPHRDKGSLRKAVGTGIAFGRFWGARMITSRRKYLVSRPVYSEDSFAEDHERISRQRKTMLDHVREYLTWVELWKPEI